MKNKSYLLLLISFFASFCVNASISIDRTRVIVNEADGGGVVTVTNNNELLPYLAQAWVEDAEKGKLKRGPIIITPPIQRIEPKKSSQIRVTKLANAKLPKNKESLFYFNVREIPPKSDGENVMQIALHTRVKLFYRPLGIEIKDDASYSDLINLKQVGKKIIIENSSPYFVTILKFNGTNGKNINKSSFMMEPFTSKEFNSARLGGKYSIEYINDYGGSTLINFNCNNKKTCENIDNE